MASFINLHAYRSYNVNKNNIFVQAISNVLFYIGIIAYLMFRSLT